MPGTNRSWFFSRDQNSGGRRGCWSWLSCLTRPSGSRALCAPLALMGCSGSHTLILVFPWSQDDHSISRCYVFVPRKEKEWSKKFSSTEICPFFQGGNPAQQTSFSASFVQATTCPSRENEPTMIQSWVWLWGRDLSYKTVVSPWPPRPNWVQVIREKVRRRHGCWVDIWT